MKEYQIGTFADMLGVTIQTLRNWDNAGKLRPYKVSKGGTRYYSHAQLEEYSKKNKVSNFKLKGILYLAVSNDSEMINLAEKVALAKSLIDSKKYDYTVVTDILNISQAEGYQGVLESLKTRNLDILFLDADMFKGESILLELFKQLVAENNVTLKVLNLGSEEETTVVSGKEETAENILEAFDSFLESNSPKVTSVNKSLMIKKLIEL